MEYKLFSDNEDFTRETSHIQNDNEPYWSGVNYGSLEALTSYSKDGNGSSQKQVGDSDQIVDMLENANAESKYAPTPNGLTVFKLPGIQPSGKAENTFAFTVDGNRSVIAPRNYYLTNEKVPISSTGSGDLLHNRQANAKTISINVMQVPYGEDQIITDASGTAGKASDTAKVAEAIGKSLDQLSKLSKDNASKSALTNHLFKKDGGLSDSYTNINNMINSGNYADAYKSSLSVALGEKGKSMYDVAIETKDGNIKDAFDQFNFIYSSLKNGNNKYYSPALVEWGQDNADTIIHTLMVNYFFQKQFKGEQGQYETPISLNRWVKNGKKISYYNDLVAKGNITKEPFYLYTVINPDANSGKKKLEPIDSKYIVPDLSYIYSLYSAIHLITWKGADGKLNLIGSMSQTWENAASDMTKKMSRNRVSGKSLPSDANKIDQDYSDYKFNNLVSGLSSTDGNKIGTKEVYTADLNIIGALRTLLSKGEATSGKQVVINGKGYAVTSIGETRYSKAKVADSFLYSVFAKTGGDTYDKWATMINSSDDIPISPAIFNSYWNTGSSEAAYVIMPVMLGGEEFPKALKTNMTTMMDNPELGRRQVNLSYTNRYIMTFNLKSEVEAKATNRSGVTEVYAGKGMGKALDTSKPIVMTGYLGGEEFSIIDYFKTLDSINEGRDNPNLKVNGKDGSTVQMQYLDLFEHFFTIKTDKDFVGDKSKGTIKYSDNLDVEQMKSRYTANSSKSLVRQISPDYSSFFSSETVEEEE